MMHKKIIPYGRQHITQEDIESVINALTSDYLTQGPLIKQFEDDFAAYIGSKYAVAVSNGTAALHLGAMALGVTKGTNVITTPITFAASSNCIKYCEGNVWFADIDPQTYLLDIQKVEELILSKPTGFFQGIIPVDFAGKAVNLEGFRKLADQYSLWIMEDACHAPGGYFIDTNTTNQLCGNGNFTEIAVFSFHPVKHIATGEGGMITTNDFELYKKLMLFRTHGITRDSEQFKNSIDTAIGEDKNTSPERNWPGWYMEMQSLGFNYRLTDFQAALGITQLKRLEESLLKRRLIAKRYQEALANKPWIIGQSGDITGHAYHLYIIEVNNRMGLYNALKDKNIFAQIHYVPTHLMPYYRELGSCKGDFPKAEKYYDHCISLPMYPTLTLEEQEFVIDSIKNFFETE